MSAMRYIGGGSFLIGVPARDLTADEAELYRDMIAGSSLYEPIDNEAEEMTAKALTPAAEKSEGE